MRLYELTSSYEQLLEMAEQLDEETLRDTLESINEAIEEKVENTAYVIKSLEANVKIIDEEVKRLQAMKSTQQRNIKSLKEYIQESMEKVGLGKIEGSLIKVSIQNNPPSVRLDDDFKIGKYLVSVEPKFDKKAILSDLKQGLDIPGAEMVQGKSIRIR
jgi:hypothetical protein